jgi:hypothetical protein
MIALCTDAADFKIWVLASADLLYADFYSFFIFSMPHKP